MKSNWATGLYMFGGILLLPLVLSLFIRNEPTPKKEVSKEPVSKSNQLINSRQMVLDSCDCTVSQGTFSAPLEFISTNGSAISFYNYGNPVGASSNTGLELSDAMLIMIHEDLNTGITSLVLILDKGQDGSGGEVNLTFNCLPSTANVVFSDDGGELTGSPPNIVGNFFWGSCCTDGGIIGGVGCGSTFTINPDIISGIDDFSIVSGSPNDPIYIPMPQLNCPITINCGGQACCEDIIEVEATAEDATCGNSMDGSIDLSTACVTNPTFAWSEGSDTEDIGGLNPGIYSVTVTDENGCMDSTSVEVGAPSNMVLQATAEPSSCNSGSDGGINLTITGGTSPYTFDWSDNSFDGQEDPSGMNAGLYFVTVTDIFGCTAETSAEITEPTPLEVIYETEQATCGQPNGFIGLTVSGGVGPYTFDWSDNSLDGQEDPSFVFAGLYAVTVTDANGCTEDLTLEVPTPPELEIVIAGENPLCFGDNTGNIFVDILGGTFPYSYDWNNNTYDNLEDLLNVEPGYYFLIVTDANSCSAIADIEVTEPEAMTTDLAITSVSCFGSSDGQIDLTVEGGSLPFYFNWSDDTYDGAEDPFNLTAGDYIVTITDLNGCSVVDTGLVVEPEEILVSYEVQQATCNQSNGAISLDISGGAGAFTYDWSVDSLDGIEDPAGIPAGYYVVVVGDSSGCVVSETIEVNQPSDIDATGTAEEATCGLPNGSITLSLSGGVGSYEFDWSVDSLDGIDNPSGLFAGFYDVTVSDTTGCSVFLQFEITEPQPLVLSSTAEQATCGAANGSIDLSVSGGTAPYVFDWSVDSLDGIEDPINLAAGIYFLTLSDANDCELFDTIEVTTPSSLSLTLISAPTLCNGSSTGSIEVEVINGTLPYIFNWNDDQYDGLEDLDQVEGGNYSLTVSDGEGCSVVGSIMVEEPAALDISGTAFQTSCFDSADGQIVISVTGGVGDYSYEWDNSAGTDQNPEGLISGDYVVTVTDQNGCTASAAFLVSAPSALASTAQSASVSCFNGADGSIDITVSGGTLPYSFQWSHSDTVEIEDPSGLSAGIYAVVITDDNGCVHKDTVQVEEPLALLVTGTANQATCGYPNGSIDLEVTGGTGMYQFDWELDSLDGLQTPQGLLAGLYSATVTDDNGCSASLSTQIPTPPVLEIQVTGEDALCFGSSSGQLSTNVSGGAPPYSYDWNVDVYDGLSAPSDVPAGIYLLTVIDINDCQATDSVMIGQPAAISANTNPDAVSCFNGQDGSIDLTVSGGTTPYFYEWDNGAGAAEDPISLSAGIYKVTITDNNGCTGATMSEVLSPSPVEASYTSLPASCYGSADGSIDLTVTGGIPSYNYSWSGGATDGVEDQSGLAAGNYEVTISDVNSCTTVLVTEVNQPEALEVDGVALQAFCGSANGSINLTITGGIAPYSFDWSDDNLDGQEDPANLIPGTYEVTVADANDCHAPFSITISTPEELTATLSGTDAQCFGTTDGLIELIVSGGAPPYSYDWSDDTLDGQGGPIAVGAGVYSLTITDGNACTFTATTEIGEPPFLEASGISTMVSCYGGQDGVIDLSVIGGTKPYTYDWEYGGQDEDPTGLVAGLYPVTVTDANGCTYSVEVEVAEPPSLAATLTPVAVSCFGGTDGSVVVDVAGGVGGYTYDWSDNAFDGIASPAEMGAGTYFVTITDANDCMITEEVEIIEPAALSVSSDAAQATCGNPNGSITLTVNGGTSPYNFDWNEDSLDGTEDPINLYAGPYTVTIIDANGCQLVDNIFVPTPPDLVGEISASDALCFGEAGGSISVEISGGTSPYDYDWSDNALDGIEDPSGVVAGNYSVTVTDANGCSVSLSADVSEPSLLEASASSTSVSCNAGSDGAIDLEVLGGVSPYIFVWSNGAGMVEDPADLMAGNYQVTVTDMNGCTVISTAIISEPSALSLSLIAEAAKCHGSSDGQINSTVSGGTLPYSYQWNNNIGSDEDPIDLAAGIYAVTVTDGNGCTLTGSTQVNEPSDFVLSVNVSDYGNYNVSCTDSSDGNASVEIVSGGTAPYAVEWSTGAGSPTAENLSAGTYSFTVTDAEGCTKIDEVQLIAPEAIFANLIAESVTCFGDEDGVIHIEQPEGGIPPYRYRISGIAATSNAPVFNNLDAGEYVITVVDAEGCQWEENVLVPEPPELTVNLGDDILLILGDSVELIADVNDPFNIANVRWTGPIGEDCPNCLRQMVAPFITTDYSTTVIDSSGCRATDEVRVRVDQQRPIYIPTAFSPNGDGYNDVFYIGAGSNVVQIDELYIFDRWGEQVFFKQSFQPNDALEGWDGVFGGRVMEPGVYVYYIKVTFIDGQEIVYKGGVTLVK